MMKPAVERDISRWLTSATLARTVPIALGRRLSLAEPNLKRDRALCATFQHYYNIFRYFFTKQKKQPFFS